MTDTAVRLSEAQRRVLSKLEASPGGRTTAFIFYQWCSNSKTIRALFSRGMIEGDGIPATYVWITPAGRAALTQGRGTKP